MLLTLHTLFYAGICGTTVQEAWKSVSRVAWSTSVLYGPQYLSNMSCKTEELSMKGCLLIKIGVVLTC